MVAVSPSGAYQPPTPLHPYEAEQHAFARLPAEQAADGCGSAEFEERCGGDLRLPPALQDAAGTAHQRPSVELLPVGAVRLGGAPHRTRYRAARVLRACEGAQGSPAPLRADQRRVMSASPLRECCDSGLTTTCDVDQCAAECDQSGCSPASVCNGGTGAGQVFAALALVAAFAFAASPSPATTEKELSSVSSSVCATTSYSPM